MNIGIKSVLLGTLAVSGGLAVSGRADACGGFFCSQIQPVNQAAEKIIFADNGDGTQTAVIEIMYDGPSEHFSWLLPISSVPKGNDLAVASDLAFQRLQAATNPQYTLTTRVEGTCKPSSNGSGGSGGRAAGGFPSSGGASGESGHDGVVVEASGVIGAFEWTVISVDDQLPKPEDAAVNWLSGNGYDVPAGAASLIAPYMADGLYLLALKLTKGATVGSIRPISLTYDADRPMIPVKLTAVAANENMGVMTWVLGSARAVPQNYYALELNEARINWFNPASNYNAVVTAAADDVGQGFVTEYAGATATLGSVVWSSYDESRWQSVKTRVYSSLGDLFIDTYYTYGAFDGYWDAVTATVTLPQGVTLETFQACPYCYSADITFDPATLLDALETQVMGPMRDVQDLLDAHPQITRLYTTMSAEDMTKDPLFTFNADLGEVSNIHTAERVIECSPDLYQFQAPWRIELPQGSTVRGTADDASSLTWPPALADLDPNRLISMVGETGSGKVYEDNLAHINEELEVYNATVPVPDGSGGESASGGTSTGGTSAGKGGVGGKGGTSAGGKGGTGTGGTTGGTVGASGADDGGGATGGTPSGTKTPPPRGSGSHNSCAITPGSENGGALSGLLGLLLLAVRRRRATRR